MTTTAQPAGILTRAASYRPRPGPELSSSASGPVRWIATLDSKRGARHVTYPSAKTLPSTRPARDRAPIVCGPRWTGRSRHDQARSRPLTMLIVNPLHAHYDPAHLEHVIAEMRRRGRPRLRAYPDPPAGLWHAREGTHRLRACLALGLVPELLPIPWGRTHAALVRARHLAARNAHRFPDD